MRSRENSRTSEEPHPRAHLGTFVGGLVGGIERKSVEPIALENGQERGPLQHFVGSSKWDESPLLARLRLEVSQEIGDPDAVLVVDGSAVPKKGRDSVGVTRQWCGRLGKVENCQVGVYLAYAASGSGVLVDRRLYLPRDWAKDKARRKKVHVPADVKFKRAWELADEMLATSGSQLPHKWIVGDDEYGRPSAFRDRLAERSERYVLEVPSSTSVRKLRADSGRPPMWHTIKALVRRAPVDAWDSYQDVTDRRARSRFEQFVFRSRPGGLELTRVGKPCSSWRHSTAVTGGTS